MSNDKKVNIKINGLGCIIPVIAFLCLLALLEIIAWKTALIIGLIFCTIPLGIALFGVLLVLIGIVSVGVCKLTDYFKYKKYK